MTEQKEKSLQAWVSKSSDTLRKNAQSLPPEGQDRDVREGVAASAELGLLILQKLGALDVSVALLHKDLEYLRRDMEGLDRESRLTDLLIDGHRRQIGLHEEVTRADLNLKKERTQRTERIVMRIIAAVLTPPAMITFWQWLVG